MKPIHKAHNRSMCSTEFFVESDSAGTLLLRTAWTMMKGDTSWIQDIITCKKKRLEFSFVIHHAVMQYLVHLMIKG